MYPFGGGGERGRGEDISSFFRLTIAWTAKKGGGGGEKESLIGQLGRRRRRRRWKRTFQTPFFLSFPLLLVAQVQDSPNEEKKDFCRVKGGHFN